MENGTALEMPFELFGIECGKGWYPLIYPIIAEIHLHNSLQEDEDAKIHISQIKEKFGGLRFYSSGTDKIMKMIEKAERDSYYVCEKCGTRKNVGMTRSGWYTTCCKNHIPESHYDPNWKKNKPRWVCDIEHFIFQINHNTKFGRYIRKQGRKVKYHLTFMTREQKIKNLEKRGWTVTKLGKNIKIEKPSIIKNKEPITHHGSVHKIHKQEFLY